ncbi:acyl carrier protein [Streptomyces sp. R28]|uniref:Acyl carrier protein n=1 Tax=Streptomyces sp. R28 TaxID=3238628 RepID=A0AB39PS04_9ACTN
MSRTDDQVKQLLVEQFGVPAERIAADQALQELSLDSLALEELRTVAEEHFDIDLETAVIGIRDTVGALVSVIEDAVINSTVAGR